MGNLFSCCRSCCHDPLESHYLHPIQVAINQRAAQQNSASDRQQQDIILRNQQGANTESDEEQESSISDLTIRILELPTYRFLLEHNTPTIIDTDTVIEHAIMILIRERRRVRDEARANGHREIPDVSEEEWHIDDVIREYEEVLVAHGREPEYYWTRRFDAPMQSGLTPERIDKFSQFEAGESQKSVTGKQCAVCLNEIQAGTRVIRLNCRHVYCSTCILPWFADNNTCPYCRRKY